MQKNFLKAQSAQKPFISKGFWALVSQIILFPLNVVYTETYQKVLVFDDNRNSLYTNYLYYLYYHRFLLSKPAVSFLLSFAALHNVLSLFVAIIRKSGFNNN